MMVVGLTGGIGSGKSTVAKQFNALGVPVYIADIEAKALINSSEIIKKKLIDLFGNNAYIGGELNKSYIADIIFNDKVYLEKMNAIIHPKVKTHFEKWVLKQNTPYVIKEVAILFENGGDNSCDFIITVTAPKDLRIERILKRDNTTAARIEAIMNNQWTDEQKIKKSHFVIDNTDLELMQKQVITIHKQLMDKCI